MLGKRVYGHCYGCGTTEPDAHFEVSGYCRPCLKIRNASRKQRPCTHCHEALGVAGGYCKPCRDSYAREYNRTHRQELNAAQRQRWEAGWNARESALRKRYSRAAKLAVIEAYGGCCACCGEIRWEFLAIDHERGDGQQHRKAAGAATSGPQFYRWLRKHGYPQDQGLRILCHNCNQALGMRGACPHGTTVTVNRVVTALKTPAAQLAQQARQRVANRAGVLAAYGGICACCGEQREPFLSLDHIDGGGKQARLKIGGNRLFYAWLTRNQFPSIGLRVLCHNCNQARGFYGYCPDDETRDKDNMRWLDIRPAKVSQLT